MAYFADTWFWVALLNKADPHHSVALALNRKVGTERIVTSQLVMIELFGHFCELGQELRLGCTKFVKRLNTMAHITVVPYSNQLYDDAMHLYEQVSSDKEWSLVDCASFNIMAEQGIGTALTGDHHFEQRGYMLLRPND